MGDSDCERTNVNIGEDEASETIDQDGNNLEDFQIEPPAGLCSGIFGVCSIAPCRLRGGLRPSRARHATVTVTGEGNRS